ncbi:MAG: PIN domain-containing protein [Planctomycetes bacterium]|nr:PIN domain-containing protein [Planctomycetota bacterium]
MRFWDSSALVPLVVEQRSSGACRRLLRSDRDVVAWALAPTEMWSAACRLRREGALGDAGLAEAESRLLRLSRLWHEIVDLEAVRLDAARIIRGHGLRAADALQLAAAVVASGFRPRGRPFVCLDEDLCATARREGFDVIRPA